MDRKNDEWKDITKSICEMIHTSGKTKTQIALEVGISKATLSQYLSGRAYPSLATLKILCRVLNCTYDDILGTL